MNFANIAFLLVGVIGGLMALVGMLGALKGTPVRAVKSFGRGARPAVGDPAFRDTVEMLSMCSSRMRIPWRSSSAATRPIQGSGTTSAR